MIHKLPAFLKFVKKYIKYCIWYRKQKTWNNKNEIGNLIFRLFLYFLFIFYEIYWKHQVKSNNICFEKISNFYNKICFLVYTYIVFIHLLYKTNILSEKYSVTTGLEFWSFLQKSFSKFYYQCDALEFRTFFRSKVTNIF